MQKTNYWNVTEMGTSFFYAWNNGATFAIEIFITPTMKIVIFASQMGCENKKMQTSRNERRK